MVFRACRQMSCGCCSLGFLVGGTLTVLLMLHFMWDDTAVKDMAGVTHLNAGYSSTLAHSLLDFAFVSIEEPKNTVQPENTIQRRTEGTSPAFVVDCEVLSGTGMMDVSVGEVGVWALASNNTIYAWVNTDWKLVDHLQLNDISVGSSVFGLGDPSSMKSIWTRLYVNEANPVGSRWQQVQGHLQIICISRNDNLWGVNKDGQIWSMAGVHGKWHEHPKVSEPLVVITVGDVGVWALSDKGNLFYKTESYGDPDEIKLIGTPWTKVAADFKYIDAGEHFLWACDNDDIVWRHYIDQEIHMGEWTLVPGLNYKRLSTYTDDVIWGISSSGQVERCQSTNIE